MTWVDVVLLVGVVLVAVSGWRAGVITTVASFLGFIGGAVFGAWLVPQLLDGRDWAPVPAALAMVGAMVVLGLIGQAIMGFVGRAVRDVVDVGPIRLLDQASGMVVSTIAFLLAAWMVLTVAASLALTEDAVRASRSYPLLDQMLAGPGSELIDDARSLLSTLDLPSLPFNTATLPQVDEPSDSALGSALTAAARSSVVQVAATSSRCGVSQVGSGVVMAPERVVTNVHVITGSGRVTIRLPGERSARPAQLVEVDRANDVAVLYVPGLEAPALEWADDTSRGTQGGVAGYPGGGRLTLGAARVRGTAAVADGAGTGSRRVLVFRGEVRPGNSGGALLDESGDVMGVVFANSSVDGDTGFALTRSEVRRALAGGSRATAEISSGACPVR